MDFKNGKAISQINEDKLESPEEKILSLEKENEALKAENQALKADSIMTMEAVAEVYEQLLSLQAQVSGGTT